jgi:hypothetical protein
MGQAKYRRDRGLMPYQHKEDGVGAKVDYLLFEVQFVTWRPWSAEEIRRGQHDSNAKMMMGIKLWAPVPVDDEGQIKAELMKPEEQGGLWAVNEVIRLKPGNQEVLSIINVRSLDLMKSTIHDSDSKPEISPVNIIV